MTVNDNRYYLTFDGNNDYIEFDSNESVAGLSTFTISLWARPDTFESTDTIWNESYTTYKQNTLTGTDWTTRSNNTGTAYTLATPTIGTGDWHHIAFVYDAVNNEKSIYVDGSREAYTSQALSALSSGRDKLRVGYPLSGDTYYDGRIDDIKIYNTALSASDIDSLANNSRPQTTPLYHWKCNERTGTSLNNAMTSNDSTLVGATWGYELSPIGYNTGHNFSIGLSFIVPAVTKDCLYDQIKYAGRIGTISTALGQIEHYDTTTDDSNTLSVELSNCPEKRDTSLSIYVENYSIQHVSSISDTYIIDISGYTS